MYLYSVLTLCPSRIICKDMSADPLCLQDGANGVTVRNKVMLDLWAGRVLVEHPREFTGFIHECDASCEK